MYVNFRYVHKKKLKMKSLFHSEFLTATSMVKILNSGLKIELDICKKKVSMFTNEYLILHPFLKILRSISKF